MDNTMADLQTRDLTRWAEQKSKMTFLLERASSGEDPQSALKELYHSFHSLVGNGATYGFSQISQTAEFAQTYVESLLDEKGETPGPQTLRVIDTFIENLNRDFSDAKETHSKSNVGKEPTPTSASASPSKKDHVHGDLQKIAVIDLDPATADELTKSLGRIRHELVSWDGQQDPLEFLKAARPNVILMDTNLGERSGFDLCKALKKTVELSAVPVLFMSKKADLHERVQGVRAGGEAFFAKPLSSDTFIESMEIMGTAPLDVPIRVLTVEDDPNQIQFNKFILEKSGYLVEPCSNPEHLLHLLESFSPDVLLMDVNLPHYNGFELARALRQDDRFLTLPIIFLTSMDEASSYLEGLQAGSDDYLVKPVDPQILLSCVRSRSKRSLMMRTISDQDGLTRLLNRSSLMRQLDSFISRATRYGELISVVLIDIDNFKEVNDSHAHQSGDWVLRDLASYLQERFRESDLIGRYGGEEFLIVLPRLPAEEAANIVDRLRQEYGKRELHLPNGKTVNITFSGGVAAYRTHGASRDDVIAAADAALYIAKESGRDQIITARIANI